MEATAKMTSTATFTSATVSDHRPVQQPEQVVGGPNGTTQKARNAVIAEMIGAR